ncbi:MAG: hypothetical protein ACK4TA_11090, partial [Saprospiraceae bacterium]
MTRLTLFLFVPALFLGVLHFSYQPAGISQKMSMNEELYNPYWTEQHTASPNLAGSDGPHLFWQGDSLRVVEVSGANEVAERLIKPDDGTVFTCQVANADQDQFSFTLQPNPTAPPAVYEQPKRLLAISDIEGNFNAFYSLLLGNHV